MTSTTRKQRDAAIARWTFAAKPPVLFDRDRRRGGVRAGARPGTRSAVVKWAFT